MFPSGTNSCHYFPKSRDLRPLGSRVTQNYTYDSEVRLEPDMTKLKNSDTLHIIWSGMLNSPKKYKDFQSLDISTLFNSIMLIIKAQKIQKGIYIFQVCLI